MAHWRLNNTEASGYWNPPPPSQWSSSASSTSSTESFASNLMIKQERTDDDEGLKTALAIRSQDQDSDSEMEVMEVAQIKKSEKAQLIELDDSEDEDYDVCIARQLSSSSAGPQPKQKKQSAQEEKRQKEISNPSENELYSRVTKYQTKFGKLRYMYDRLKKDNADLKQIQETMKKEIGKRRDKDVRQSSELTRLQTEIGEKNAQVQLLQGKIGALERELECARPSNLTLNNLMQQNWTLTKRVEELEVALGNAYFGQMTSYKAQKEQMEKSSQTYHRLFRGGALAVGLKSLVAPEPSKHLNSDSNKEAEPAWNASTVAPLIPALKATTPSAEDWPKDPRLKKRDRQ